MKKVILRKIVLSNWKGQNREVYFSETQNKIEGRNGIGKTSINKAFCWLLTGYTDSVNVRNHELFDNKKSISPDTPEAVVSAVLDIDGAEVKLERHAIASFVRKRGSNEYVKSASDTYKLCIDDIEVSTTSFNEYIANVFGSIDNLPFMVMGDKFANLSISDKNKARKVLESIIDVITSADMKGDYSSIQTDIDKYGIDVLTERYKNQLKPLNQYIASTTAIIEVKENDLSRLKQTDFDGIADKIKLISADIKRIDEEIMGQSDAIQPIIEKRAEILKIVHEKATMLGERRNAYMSMMNDAVAQITADIKTIDAENERIRRENEYNTIQYAELGDKIESLSKSIDLYEKERALLLKEKDEIMNAVFSDDKCAYCGQTLPADKLDEMKEKFNEQKQARLSRVVSRGKQVRAQLDSMKDERLELLEKQKKGVTVKPYIDKAELEAKKKEALTSFPMFEQTDEYKAICAEIDKLKESMPDVVVPSSDALKQKKENLMSELEEMNRAYGQKTIMQNTIADIEEMRNNITETGISIAKIEGMIDKVKEYIEERANIISDRINERLKTCRIVMYSRQKDGEMKPDCVIESLDGIKYSTMNNSARIKVALEIQDMFCKHYGLSMPVFVDEASIFDSYNIPQFEAQTIYLYASNNDFNISEA